MTWDLDINGSKWAEMTFQNYFVKMIFLGQKKKKKLYDVLRLFMTISNNNDDHSHNK